VNSVFLEKTKKILPPKQLSATGMLMDFVVGFARCKMVVYSKAAMFVLQAEEYNQAKNVQIHVKVLEQV